MYALGSGIEEFGVGGVVESSCLIESKMLAEGESSWSSDGNVALLGVLRGGRIGLTFGIFAKNIGYSFLERVNSSCLIKVEGGRSGW